MKDQRIEIISRWLEIKCETKKWIKHAMLAKKSRCYCNLHAIIQFLL